MRKHLPISLPLFLFLPTILFLLTACATGSTTGVRKDFQNHQVQTLAISPFYARGTFGIEPDHFEEIRQFYEAAAAQRLGDQGFLLLSAGALKEQLQEAGLWETFDEGIRLRRNLTHYFEPTRAGAPPPIEVAALRELHREGPLPFDAILFAEILYQTEGTCRKSAESYVSYAEVITAPDAPCGLPSPCVTSHFQAKLVDLQTGHTIWFNRMLVETYAPEVNENLRRENIIRAINSTFHDASGLPGLIPTDPVLP